MLTKPKIQKALQHTRILRYKAYKKVGVAKHRRKIDLSLFLMFMLCTATFPFFILPSTQPQPESRIEQDKPIKRLINPDAIEKVHTDLGDAPVETRPSLSLDEIERRTQLGEIDMTIRTLTKGDSLLSLLSDEKVDVADRMAIADALEIMMDLKSLRPGMGFLLFWEKDKTLVGLSIQVKEGENIAVLREKDGDWTPFSAAGRIETQTIRKQGTIERTFSGSALKAGIPESVIAQVSAALDGEIDFQSDVTSGDTFDVIFETKMTPGGLEIGRKELLFIGLKVGDKEYNRYAYTDASGTPMFYDARGKSGEKTLLKRPLKGRSRLSSAYGKRRHPILMYEIFHHGVDLAAPMNTPIQAAADGTITQLGRKGAYGKYIRIRHADGYQSAYGHMNGYRQDLKVGSKVKRGEVIGYVGSTGRSTGPHVHFEVWKNNKTVNPFGRNVIKSNQLKNFELEQFFAYAEGLHPDFAKHRAGKVPPPPPPKPQSIIPKPQKRTKS
jgi:murein DD-endopeptidase MepM/ murein hydrolase activator NlpD